MIQPELKRICTHSRFSSKAKYMDMENQETSFQFNIEQEWACRQLKFKHRQNSTTIECSFLVSILYNSSIAPFNSSLAFFYRRLFMFALLISSPKQKRFALTKHGSWIFNAHKLLFVLSEVRWTPISTAVQTRTRREIVPYVQIHIFASTLYTLEVLWIPLLKSRQNARKMPFFIRQEVLLFYSL